MSSVLLQANDLLPCFETTAGDRVPASADSAGASFSLSSHSITAILGADAGRVSAWLRCLAGLEDPCRGRVLMRGEDLSRLDKRSWQRMRTRIAYLSNDSRLLSVLSMRDNIIQPALYHKLGSREELLDRAQQLLDEIGPVDDEVLGQLPAYLDTQAYAQALIVRSLLLQPDIIILDDFFRAYSKKQSEPLLQYIFIKLEQHDMAALVYDHPIGSLLDKCSHSLFVTDRGLLQFDTTEALLASDNEELKAFLLDSDFDIYGE